MRTDKRDKKNKDKKGDKNQTNEQDFRYSKTKFLIEKLVEVILIDDIMK